MEGITQANRLEPAKRFLTLVILGHLLFAGIVWWWLEYKRMSRPAPVEAKTASWMIPAQIVYGPASPKPEPVPIPPPKPSIEKEVPKVAPPPTAPAESAVPKAIPFRPVDRSAKAVTTTSPAGSDSGRFVTVSRLKNDGNTAHELDAVDSAIIEGFRSVWLPPGKLDGATAEERTAHLEIAVGREGQLYSFRFASPPQNEPLKLSVLDAANRLANFSKPLPEQFHGERYSVQVHFYVE